MRFLISQYVLNQNCVPLNPFLSLDYYLSDMVDRDVVRNANNNMLRISEELWVFGDISDGVEAEIIQTKEQGKVIKYFKMENDKEIIPIEEKDVKYERE